MAAHSRQPRIASARNSEILDSCGCRPASTLRRFLIGETRLLGETRNSNALKSESVQPRAVIPKVFSFGLLAKRQL